MAKPAPDFDPRFIPGVLVAGISEEQLDAFRHDAWERILIGLTPASPAEAFHAAELDRAIGEFYADLEEGLSVKRSPEHLAGRSDQLRRALALGMTPDELERCLLLNKLVALFDGETIPEEHQACVDAVWEEVGGWIDRVVDGPPENPEASLQKRPRGPQHG